MYDTLVEFDLETYEIVPSLATTWTVSLDGLTWTFNLREGVTFHDGSPFGAEDVVVSMGRAQEPESGRTSSLLTRVVGTVAVDDMTVEIRLGEPDRILASTLVDVYISPRDPDIDLNETPIGTGPFKFVEWERNQQVEIVRNENFWQEGLPYLDVRGFSVLYRRIVSHVVHICPGQRGIGVPGSSRQSHRVAPNRIAMLITIEVTHRSNRRYRTFSGLAEREKQG